MKRLLLLLIIIGGLTAFTTGDDEDGGIACTGISSSTYGAADLALVKARVLSLNNGCDEPLFFQIGSAADDDLNFFLGAGEVVTLDLAHLGGSPEQGAVTANVYIKKVSSTPSAGTLYISYIRQ